MVEPLVVAEPDKVSVCTARRMQIAQLGTATVLQVAHFPTMMFGRPRASCPLERLVIVSRRILHSAMDRKYRLCEFVDDAFVDSAFVRGRVGRGNNLKVFS